MPTDLSTALAKHAASLRSLSNAVAELSDHQGITTHNSRALFDMAMQMRDHADVFDGMRSQLPRAARDPAVEK